MALTIEAIDEQFITVGTVDYNLSIDIGGDPDSVEPKGDMEGFYHDWDADNDRLHIKSDEVTRLIAGAEWNINLMKGSDTVIGTIIYNVVPAAPVFTDPGEQTLYKGIPFSLKTEVANVPTILRGSGLLVGVKGVAGLDADGDAVLDTEGMLPSDAELTEDSFMLNQYAENDGGSDTIDVPVTILGHRWDFIGAMEGSADILSRFIGFK